MALVLVVLLALGAVGQWRLGVFDDLGDRLGLAGADPRTDPGSVSPPPGLRLTPQAAARPVARSAQAGALDPAAVHRALAPYVGSRALARHLDVVVADLSGHVVYRHGSGAVIPASTMKLLTSTAALETIGPGVRFTTSVRRVAGTHRIVLVGGGDPYLASRDEPAEPGQDVYPRRATTAALATATAGALKQQGISRVRLGYDDSLFTGPAVNPTWPHTYLTEDVVPPVSALWVDEGRDPTGSGYVADPAATAAEVFARQLRVRGITVRGTPTRRSTPAAAVPVAEVRSAPLGQIVQRLVSVSDNNAAEVVLRQVGLARSNDGTFVGGTTAVRQVLGRLGVSLGGLRMHDGSGLSRKDRLRPRTLVDVLSTAASADHPELRQVVTGLPVAGFTGSLTTRYDEVPAAGRGRVRAKTGTLTGVSGLAGIATDLTGTPMVFAALADRIPEPRTLAARAALDRITAALGACHCGRAGSADVGSTP